LLINIEAFLFKAVTQLIGVRPGVISRIIVVENTTQVVYDAFSLKSLC